MRRQPAVPLQPVVDPAAWRAADVSDANTFTLDDAHLGELDAALARVAKTGLPIEQTRRTDFPFGRLAQLLGEVRRELIDGTGFALLRGFPVARYSRAQTVTAFWGIGAYMGRAVMQNAGGHLMAHETDLGPGEGDAIRRYYLTREDTDYHAERCDIVGLCCLQQAKQGGEIRLASSVTVYNEMLKRRPDLVAEMIKPLYRDRRGDVPGGKEPWYVLPMFTFHNGYLSVRGGNLFVKSAQRFPEVPRLTPAQIEALDLMQAIAHESAISLPLAPGEILFLHSHVVLFARGGFEDWAEPARKRHMLRLWLNTDLAFGDSARPLTPDFAEAVQGIPMPGVHPHVPLDAN